MGTKYVEAGGDVVKRSFAYGAVSDLLGTFIRAAIVMVAAGYVHDHELPVVPAIGYWTALVLCIGVGSLIGGVYTVKDWREVPRER